MSYIAWIAERLGNALVLRDPSGEAAVKIAGPRGPDVAALPLETLVWIKGFRSGDVLVVEDFAVIHSPVEERRVKYFGERPVPDEYAANYHWYIRGERAMRAARLYHELLRVARGFLAERGFLEIEAPMVGIVSDPGLRGARKLVTKAYGRELELMSSVIMYKQLMASVFEKIFYVARNVREEPVENAKTGRHLFEFTQLDLEWALSSMEDVMRLAEDLIYHAFEKLRKESPELLGAVADEPELLRPPYPVLTYDEALDKLKSMGVEERWGQELSQAGETKLSEALGKPFWLVMFPSASRGFYYYPLESDPRYNMDFNLILPRGYGEVIDGGCREYRYERLKKRIESLGESVEKYSWFLEMAKQGGVAPSCGWGLGVERMVRFLAGLEHVAYASPHPRLPGVVSP